MSEVQTNAASGAAPSNPEPIAPTPSATDYSLSDSDLFDQAVAAGEKPAAEAETPEPDELDSEAAAPAPAPEGEGEKPPTEEAKPEDAKPEDAPDEEEAGKSAPPVALTPEQKAFLKANPQLKDAVYRDRRYHELGINVKVAEAMHQSGIASLDDVQAAVQSIESIDALNADFTGRTPESAEGLFQTLKEVDAESADFVARYFASPEFQQKHFPERFMEQRNALLNDVFANARKVAETTLDPDTREDANGLIDSFEKLLEDLSRRAGERPRGAVPPAEAKRIAELEAKLAEREVSTTRDFLQNTNAKANQAVNELIGEAIKNLSRNSFTPEVREDLLKKIAVQVNETLRSQPTTRRGFRDIVNNTTLSPEERQKKAVSFIASRAKSLVGTIAPKVVRPYTAQAVAAQNKRIETKKALASSSREAASATVAARPAVAKIDYRRMSDEDVFAALERGATR